ncbi:hypothetical protein, partial [Limosilactobacillus alvi]|uniref:hypothetical protein n=1 Tax=Limosilactobacillus alvi TaxID=990412 RepID=UPI001958E307
NKERAKKLLSPFFILSIRAVVHRLPSFFITTCFLATTIKAVAEWQLLFCQSPQPNSALYGLTNTKKGSTIFGTDRSKILAVPIFLI